MKLLSSNSIHYTVVQFILCMPDDYFSHHLLHLYKNEMKQATPLPNRTATDSTDLFLWTRSDYTAALVCRKADLTVESHRSFHTKICWMKKMWMRIFFSSYWCVWKEINLELILYGSLPASSLDEDNSQLRPQL